ncbi:hypothetical protein X777_10117 [Ooceraea biroi]|uniref:Uncharacterized protein n=1 Tax=Ooceraea biroi TaxID=2015173 RepID=A0A026X2H4_OOCBI|nr:hypothetical protein X777_10117 [Ooceraea biroi]
MLVSLIPETTLGMVFDLTKRYSSPAYLLFFLNVPHNMFAISFLPEGYACAGTDRCFLLANCCSPLAKEARGEAASDLPEERKEKR